MPTSRPIEADRRETAGPQGPLRKQVQPGGDPLVPAPPARANALLQYNTVTRRQEHERKEPGREQARYR